MNALVKIVQCPISGLPTRKKIIIPDGKWVLIVQTVDLFHTEGDDQNIKQEIIHAGLVGIKLDEVDQYVIKSVVVHTNPTEQKECTTFFLAADKPFGAFLHNEYSYTWFRCARQMSQGKKGPRPSIPHPLFHRGPRSWKWIRLVDLADFLKRTPEKVWDSFIDFTGNREPPKGDNNYIYSPDLKSVVNVYGGNDLTFDAIVKHHPVINNIWISAGWTMSVLYLLHFGYEPHGW